MLAGVCSYYIFIIYPQSPCPHRGFLFPNSLPQPQKAIQYLAHFRPLHLSLSFVITTALAPFASRPSAAPSTRSALHLLELSLRVGPGVASWDFGSEADSSGALGYDMGDAAV
jgi:hypothetical protein